MKAICMLLVPALAILSLKIESAYNEAIPILHHYIKSKTGNYWNLVVMNESLAHPRNKHFIEVSLGNPPQNFSLSLDTSSPYISVGKNDCKNCHFTSKKFNQYNSSTFIDTSLFKTVSYFLGETTGRQGYDTLRSGSIELMSVPFILSDSDTFNSIPSGVAGLGYDEYGYSFITLLKNQKEIDIKSFSLDLQNSLDIPETLWIGNKSSNYSPPEEELEYIQLENTKGNWEIPCDSTKFGGVSYDHAQTAKIDLGLTLFIGPKVIVINILETLLNDYNCRLDSNIVCDCSKSYPSLVLDLAGHRFSIDSNDYLYNSNSYCYPLFGYNSIDYWILGDIFIKKYYLDFNIEKVSIGFYKSKKALVKPENESSSLYKVTIKEDGAGEIVGAIFGVFIVGAIFFVCYKCCYKNKVDVVINVAPNPGY